MKRSVLCKPVTSPGLSVICISFVLTWYSHHFSKGFFHSWQICWNFFYPKLKTIILKSESKRQESGEKPVITKRGTSNIDFRTILSSSGLSHETEKYQRDEVIVCYHLPLNSWYPPMDLWKEQRWKASTNNFQIFLFFGCSRINLGVSWRAWMLIKSFYLFWHKKN